jgi:hypothetical protein
LTDIRRSIVSASPRFSVPSLLSFYQYLAIDPLYAIEYMKLGSISDGRGRSMSEAT